MSFVFWNVIFWKVFHKISYPSEHLSSPRVFSGVRVSRSLVFCVMLCGSLFALLSILYCPLYCLSFFNLLFLITPLLFSDYPFGIFRLLINPLVSSDYPFVIFWLPLCYLLITPLLSSDLWLPLCYLLITPCYLLTSDYPFVTFRLLITPLLSCSHIVVCPSSIFGF